MQTPITTIRLSPRLKTAAQRQARRDRLSLSDAIRMLLKAYVLKEIKLKPTKGKRK